MNDVVVQADGVCRHFTIAGTTTHILKGIALTVRERERVAIIGASGSGKSTLLSLVGGLDNADAGRVTINAVALDSLTDTHRAAFRNQHIGFVYQFHHLLQEFTALENVAIPALIKGATPSQAAVASERVLSDVGLQHRLHHKPAELSGGERQRVAIARAIINQPSLILLDEPTGNLDTTTAQQVCDVLLHLSHTYGVACVMATHDGQLAQQMDTIYQLSDGMLHRLP